MEHTYLIKSGKWKIEGLYHKNDETVLPIKGQIKTDKNNASWDLQCILWGVNDESLKMQADYKISSTQNPMECSFVAKHSVLGEISGMFTVLPMIITMSGTGDDNLSLSQMIMMVNENEYKIQSVRNIDGTPYDWWEGLMTCECN